jgi:acyl-CoA dehydrogenase
MDFSLNETQRLLLSTVREFIKAELAPLEAEIEQTGVLKPQDATRIFQKSNSLGLYGMNIPEKFGGGGLSAVDTMLVEEQFGHTSDILIRRAFGNVYEALLRCEGKQIERFLLPSVKGERTCSIAITEPEAGSDAASIKTKAFREGKGWRLNGSKHFISDGEFSDFFIVSAVTDPTKRGGVSLFMVDKGLTGFTIGRDQPMMGLRGTSHVELSFQDVLLDDDCILGGEGNGFKLILETLGRVRLAQVGARAVGKATKVLTLMLDYARERKQFGAAIGTYQMIQSMIADSVIDIQTARLLVLQAASLIDEGKDARVQISCVKVQAAEMLNRVVDRAVQVYGGMGFCKDLPIEKYYRDARIYRIFDGTSEIHRIQIAKAALKGDTTLFEIL